HIIYKALLLMSAGSVLYMTGKRKCTELGGLFQSMPITCICGIIGALAISSFPLTSGFVSKSMISQAAADQHLLWIWLALAAASAGVFLHAGIKFPWFVFFQKDSGLRPPDPPANMRVAMILFSALCILIGVWPEPLYGLLPYATAYEPYTATHVVSQLQLLLFSGLAFFVMLDYLKRTLTVSLDADWVYRVLAPAVWRVLERGYQSMMLVVSGITSRSLGAAGALLKRYYGPDGLLGRTWSTGGTALWMMVLLLAYLITYLA
ncbi:MAG: proton-conducting transporter membrane subunit, partial [Burkholderiales bacterium]|nr:proton-conducting transporter membrane subunit [Burkholderiales bacterium]